MKHTVAGQVNTNRQHREQVEKEMQLITDNIKKIKAYSGTTEIHYPEHKVAFDYVDEFFPLAKIKEVTILDVSSKYLAKLGMGGIGGFYDKISHIVVVASQTRRRSTNKYDICARITKDEAIVHELIHYCDMYEGCLVNDRHLAEEFAYGMSLQYLRSKGYSDKKIIQNNFLPFLFKNEYDRILKNVLQQAKITVEQFNKFSNARHLTFQKRYGQKIHKEAKEQAMFQGWKLIKLYSSKFAEGIDVKEQEESTNRFDMLDFD